MLFASLPLSLFLLAVSFHSSLSCSDLQTLFADLGLETLLKILLPCLSQRAIHSSFVASPVTRSHPPNPPCIRQQSCRVTVFHSALTAVYGIRWKYWKPAGQFRAPAPGGMVSRALHTKLWGLGKIPGFGLCPHVVGPYPPSIGQLCTMSHCLRVSEKRRNGGSAGGGIPTFIKSMEPFGKPVCLQDCIRLLVMKPGCNRW